MSSEHRPVLFWQQPTLGWIAGCRRRGSGHTAAGTACQDHGVARLVRIDFTRLGGCALAVADGHGGRRYDRSAVGARIATRLAIQLLRRLCRTTDRDNLAGRLAEEFPRRLLRQWRRQVLRDAAERGEPPSGQVERYGTTLIVGLCTDSLCLAGQIGDGEALLLRRQGMRRLIDPDLSTLGLTTHSLCEPGARHHWRTFAGPPLQPGEILLLATDGLADSFAGDDQLARFADDLWQRLETYGPSRVAPHLPDWLDRLSCDGSGDDITILMASPAAAGGRR